MPEPKPDAPDIPKAPTVESRERLAASERLLSSLDFTERSSSLTPKSSTAGNIDETTEKTSTAEKTSLTYTAGGGAERHSIDYTKSGGELTEVTVGGTKWQRGEDGGWTAPSKDGKRTLTADKIEVTGKGRDTRVTMTGTDAKGAGVTITVGADGARTRTVSGPNGSEHSVSKDGKGKITEVSHNGHRIAVGADGKVSEGRMKGATVKPDGTVTKSFGKSDVTMNPDGSTVVTSGDRTTIGFGDGSRVYKEKGATVGVRDSEGRKIMIDRDGKATVTKGDQMVAHPLSGHKINIDSSKQPPVITKAGDPSTQYHLDGRSTKLEKTKDGTTRPAEMTDAKGRTVKLEYGDPKNPSKVTGFNGKDAKYGDIGVGTGKYDAKDIKVDHAKGKVTAKMNDGTTLNFDLSKQTATRTMKDGSTKTEHVGKGFSETRSKDGKVTLAYDSGRKWDVTEGKNGAVTKVASGENSFKVGEEGVKDIKIKDGQIRVSKTDGTVHTFKHNVGETKIPARDGQPARTVSTKYDKDGRVTEVTAGSTALGGKPSTYKINRDAASGKVTGVTDEKGKAITGPGGAALKDFSVDGRGRIAAGLEGGGKLTIDPERGTRTTEAKGHKIVESARGKVDYTVGPDGKATEAKIYAPGSDKPNFTAKLGPDGKSVVEVRDAKGEVVGRSRPDSSITVDDSGRLKTRNLDANGKVRSEVTVNPDKSRTVKEAGKTSRYTPEGVLSSVSKTGMEGRAGFAYHREGGEVAKVPRGKAPGGRDDLSVPSTVKFGDGYKLERVAGKDVARQATGDEKFILTGKDGRAVPDPTTGKPMEFKAAGVDRDGNTHVQDAKGKWHKIPPEGPLASVRRESGGAPGPARKDVKAPARRTGSRGVVYA